jgi:hypothetical protein
MAVLAVSAVTSLIFCWLYITNTREMRRLNGEMRFVNDLRLRTRPLVEESGQYAMHNPKMEALLETFGLKLNKTNAPAGKQSSSK